MPKIKEVIEAIECVAPLHLQESYDNSGLQVGDVSAEASGALLCVDVTADVIDEAVAHGCNLVVTHHPLLFHGVKCVAGRNRPEVVLAKAIQAGICIYSSHTAMDAAVGGISRRMARMLGLTDVKVLVPSRPGAQEGLGAVGNLPQTMEPMRFLQFVKEVFGSVALRYSLPVPDVAISAWFFAEVPPVSLCPRLLPPVRRSTSLPTASTTRCSTMPTAFCLSMPVIMRRSNALRRFFWKF